MRRPSWISSGLELFSIEQMMTHCPPWSRTTYLILFPTEHRDCRDQHFLLLAGLDPAFETIHEFSVVARSGYLLAYPAKREVGDDRRKLTSPSTAITLELWSDPRARLLQLRVHRLVTVGPFLIAAALR